MNAIQLSVLDGWWAEAYDGLNGFAIGEGDTHTNPDVHDARDAEALMATLVNEVVPLFYDRDRDGLPRGWVARMKRTIRTLGWRFSADRMLLDYALRLHPGRGGPSASIRVPDRPLRLPTANYHFKNSQRITPHRARSVLELGVGVTGVALGDLQSAPVVAAASPGFAGCDDDLAKPYDLENVSSTSLSISG